jgi:nitroreductase
MNEFMEILKGRRSIRRYEEKEIPEDLLNQVFEAVKWSPSWANTQCWEVVVARDPAMKAQLQGTLSQTNPALKAMIQAPVVLALCGKLQSSGCYRGQVTTKFGDWFMFDLGLATQSICLSAHALGLGTVVVGLFDHDRAKEILGVPEGYELVVMIPIGYPAKVSTAPRRRETSDFVHDGRF